jgi:hypothetical protein
LGRRSYDPQWISWEDAVALQYAGYKGRVLVESNQLVIIREGAVARLSSLASPARVIPLAAISDVAYREATPFVNGYLRLGLGGESAENVTVRAAVADENAVLFRYRDRRRFRELFLWLLHVAEINRTSGQAPEAPPDEPQESELYSSPRLELSPITQVPLTPEQQRELVTQRPSQWEYRLFVSVLLQGREALEHKWRDHELRYAPSGRHMDASAAAAYLGVAWRHAGTIVERAVRLLEPRNTERAFGRPGEPGDPEFIEQLGRRLIGAYEALLDWAADLRSINVPEELKDVFELAALSADVPIDDMRRFIDRFHAEVERIPNRLAAIDERPVVIEMHLEFHADSNVLRRYEKELRRAERRLGLR